MQVKQAMTTRPHYLSVDVTIREVAEAMRSNETGFEPLTKGNKVVGTVTDRDIAIRAVAEGKGPDDKASSIATENVLYTSKTLMLRMLCRTCRTKTYSV